MPTMSNLRVRPTLTNLSLGYRNQQFISDQIFPIIPRDTDTGEFYASGKEMFVRESDIRGIKDRANAVEHDYRKLSYAAAEHSLLEEIPAKLIRQAETSGVAAVLRIEQDAQNIVDQKLALGREVDFATQLRATASYATGNSETLAGNDLWSDYVNSNPLDKIDAAFEVVRSKIFMPPNLGIIPRAVFRKLRRHPDIVAEIDKDAKRVSLEQLADVLELDRILVPDVVQNTAAPDTSDTHTSGDVWGKDAMFLRVSDRAGLNQLSFGFLFRVRYPNTNLLAESRSWDEDDRRIHVIEGNYNEDRKIALPEAGYLFKTCIA